MFKVDINNMTVGKHRNNGTKNGMAQFKAWM